MTGAVLSQAVGFSYIYRMIFWDIFPIFRKNIFSLIYQRLNFNTLVLAY